MFTHYRRDLQSSDAASTKYVCVNNFGYYENRVAMQIRRDGGRHDCQLIYVKSGELILWDKEEKINMGAGEICLFRPGEPQIYSIAETPSSYFWIHFSGSEVERMLSFFTERRYYVGEFAEFEEFCHDYSAVFLPEEDCSLLFYEGSLIVLFSRIAERIRRGEKDYGDFLKIRRALDLMRSEYWCRRQNGKLAELCGISKDYFEKLFKRTLGVSPQQYYINLIMDRSRHLLSATNYQIGEIARLCGIDDELYFSRMFKKRTGLSPTAYRRSRA